MAATRHQITVDTLLDDLETDRRLAHASAQSGAAVAATMAKARLLGLIVERKESGQPGDFAAIQSVADVVLALRRELGQEAGDALQRLLQAPEPPELSLTVSREPSDTVN